MVLLAVFICIGALVQGSLLQDFILDDGANMDDRQWIWNRYGTAYRALYTFYEITFVPRSHICETGQVGEVGQVASIHSCICPIVLDLPEQDVPPEIETPSSVETCGCFRIGGEWGGCRSPLLKLWSFRFCTFFWGVNLFNVLILDAQWI